MILMLFHDFADLYVTNIIIYLNPISKVYINIREKNSGNQEKLVTLVS
jgi:hypothetical protein